MIIIIIFDTIGIIDERGNVLELKDLEIFQTVAKKGSITEAAKELNYVQSNITARIQKLEAKLNTPLFHRHRRGMSLTPEGKKLMQYSEKILALTKEMKQAIECGGEPSGILAIGTVETVIHLPKILAAFIQKYPNVDLSLVTGVTEALEEAVLNYELDGAFVSEADFHPDIEAYEVFEEELVIISHQQITSPDELSMQPFLSFSKGCGYRARLEAWYKDQNIVPKMMEFGTLETILRSVVAGLGITFVPRSSVAPLIENGLVYCHALPGKYSKLKTMFIRRKDSYLTATMEKFIETIQMKRHDTSEPFHLLIF